ncbi:siderophore-interacting protein [Neptunomonas qingdaonensis]|uniref:NADPH-dependent ferric siderophore reductase, contains FAD-binding and SIP domains n=1 Tax=Neptunomonas qingdaonensis TaxID=1045558 RepID=A0A1I2QUT1_9GAMM|nr:siderophore-interacting protein [Neptunomonas qingdaonensis]SFG31423.1 NADPH-dependent ferric siderophore reductase, contains FAD-binding and SIP domains [Neptunomonas qingdaonensis]
MNRPAPRKLDVIRTDSVTPHMLRVTLGGEGLNNFPANQESSYIKLMFPQPGDARSQVRTYTVRQQRANEIDVDFVIHDVAGPASAWAAQATPGDSILVGGPGPKKEISPEADWFLLIGDMTALPAISVNIASLPEDATGYAVIEVLDKADIQALPHPENFELHWVVNPITDPSGNTLLGRVRQLSWLKGQVSVWAACEFSSMRVLRKYFKEERKEQTHQLYISSYWKLDSSEEQHKQAKREDSEVS